MTQHSFSQIPNSQSAKDEPMPIAVEATSTFDF